MDADDPLPFEIGPIGTNQEQTVLKLKFLNIHSYFSRLDVKPVYPNIEVLIQVVTTLMFIM